MFSFIPNRRFTIIARLLMLVLTVGASGQVMPHPGLAHPRRVESGATTVSPGAMDKTRQQDARTRLLSPAASSDLDPSFDPGLGVTVSGAINAVAVQSDGKIVIGGSFTGYNGIGRHGIARLNSDGTVDTSFNPGNGISDVVYALAIQPDGKIVIGGSFSSYDGVSCGGVIRVNSDGSIDPSFNSGSGIGTGFNNRVRSVAIQSDGKILLGGGFVIYNGGARKGIVRVNSDGSLDTSFNPGTGVTGGLVYSVLVQADGKIVMAGSFTSYNGVSAAYVARANTNGSPDAGFNSGIQTTQGGAVYSTAIQTDGKIVVGGLFTRQSGDRNDRPAQRRWPSGFFV